MSLKVVDHPLTNHYLTILRDETTDPELFRETTTKLAYTLLWEATSDLSTRDHEIKTPLEPTTGQVVDRDVVAVAVLRAGLGLLEAALDLLPDVKVGYAGVERNEETAEPMEYYAKLPVMTDARVLVLEPMLATGGSLSWAIQKVKDNGATDITCVCVVVAPEGMKRIEAEHPDVRVVAASLDRDLNDSFYIRPGLGDMGDRLFGTL